MIKSKLYKFYGVLLDDIVELTGLEKRELHNSFKKGKEIKSLIDISSDELYWHIVEIQAYMASEYGIEVPIDGRSLSDIFKQ